MLEVGVLGARRCFSVTALVKWLRGPRIGGPAQRSEQHPQTKVSVRVVAWLLRRIPRVAARRRHVLVGCSNVTSWVARRIYFRTWRMTVEHPTCGHSARFSGGCERAWKGTATRVHGCLRAQTFYFGPLPPILPSFGRRSTEETLPSASRKERGACLGRSRFVHQG